MITLTYALQTIIALGILNVWLIRPNMATSYRGGNAKSLKEEFAVYSLPPWFMYFVGFLKVSLALLLLYGLYNNHIVPYASWAMAILMAGAVLMHFKVKDHIQKALPATLMLMMSVILACQF